MLIERLWYYHRHFARSKHPDQSQERAKDMTKTDNTAYVDLMVPGSVDEKFVTALRAKMDLARQITGDDYREWLI